MDKRKPKEILRDRRVSRRCNDWLYCAPLNVAYQENLGTLLRTCDAVGACMVVPKTRHYLDALKKGNTLRGDAGCVHFVAHDWLSTMDARIVGVELAHGATKLWQLRPAAERTVVVLGHEHQGVPPEFYGCLDEVVEIPMVGQGSSLNVAVAGSLVLYKLAGLV